MVEISFKPRLYQETILYTCIKDNTLIILPTGLGKTKTAILLATHRLNNFPNSKIIFLTPTKPLADQICKEFISSTDLKEDEVNLFTGYIQPKNREKLWNTSKVIVGTPQTIESDLINKRIKFEDTCLLIFDEAHRAIQDYSYTWLAKQYQNTAKFPRIIGLTASPGSDFEKISEVCKNLYIKEIEVRTEEDPDVKPYIQKIEIDWIKVDLPEKFKEIKKFLDACFKSKLEELKKWGLIGKAQDYVHKKQLLTLQASIHGKIARGEKDIRLWRGISITAEAIKVQHAMELLETQGINALHKYTKNLYHEAEKTKTKAIKNLVKDLNFKSAYIKTEHLIEENVEHPKLTELKKIIQKETSKNNQIKVIVFNQYRDSASHVEKELNKIENVKAKLFVGQTKKGETGLTQKAQLEIIEKFKEGEYNVLVSTSIGEEGLDIPKVDLVIFFEPIPSAIRSIQRRGRTARLQKGRLIVLMTKNTRDEAYHWIAYHKEKRMYRVLDNIKQKMKYHGKESQPTLTAFTKNNLKIFADSREKGTNVIKELVNLGADVTVQNLATADYVVSERVGIELKTKEDFINSIVDKRLLHQLKELRNNFEIPVLILQGEEDIYSVRNVHPNAVRGMLATVAVSYNIPIIPTKSPRDTAALIVAIAKREQEKEKKEFGIRTEKKPLITKEQQEFIIESLPNVGPTLAKSLLKEFRTVKKIINAKEEKLQKVEKLGPKKAKEITRVINEEYED